MKTIETLEVKVTYTVSLSNVKVPDCVYNGLIECYNERGGCVPSAYEECSLDLECAQEWVVENIKESDASEWEHEIQNMGN